MPDAHDIYRLSGQLENLAIQLEQLASEVAAAKTVKEYDSDRRKQLLSEHVAPLLPHESASAAEHLARADTGYQERFKALRQELLTAHVTLARHDALQAKFEACRSILSVQKATLAL
jgi:hypothetical protein